MARGITASHYTVTFKKGDYVSYEEKASLGCIRHPEPKDSHALIRQAFNKHAQKETLAFDTVVVRGRTFTRAELAASGVVPATAEKMPPARKCHFPPLSPASKKTKPTR